MPFGPTGAPGYFQYFMQDILLRHIGKDTAVYLDDIMIYTRRGENHEKTVCEILEILKKHTLWLKPEKCEFSRKEVEYLGLLISHNQIRMDPTKVEAITKWPSPRNVTELQRFIGFANFYRRFINQFSSITRPLHELTKNDTPFIWSDKCEESFDRLKNMFTTAPILSIADPYRPFILECDCSDFALGAILSQHDKKGILHPVAFLSRSLNKAERNYEIFDKELLAIVVAFREWRHYLEGNPHRLHAIVYTDHRNLESFMTTKQLTRRQARWAETLGCFDFDIVFRPGHLSSKPDALSRRPDLAPTREEKLSFGQLLRPDNITPATFVEVSDVEIKIESLLFDEPTLEIFELDRCLAEEDQAESKFLPMCTSEGMIPVVKNTTSATTVSPAETPVAPCRSEPTAVTDSIPSDEDLVQRIRELSATDERLLHLKESASSNQHAPPDLQVIDGIVYNNGRIEVPACNKLKQEILTSRHDSRLAGHPGRAKTFSLVNRTFTWPSLRRFVNRYVDGCGSCQRFKPSTVKPFGTLEPLPIPAGPWTDITDLPLSNDANSILMVVDRLTKMAHFIPCKKSLNAEQLADLMLRYVWKLHGTPKTIVSDRGSIFVSQITRELNNQLGIVVQPSTAFHPRTDGQSEITNKAVEQYLRHFVNYHQDDWEPLLAMAEFAYNNNDHRAIGTSPFRANYGYHPGYGRIPQQEQCVPAVEARLKQIEDVQAELKECMKIAQQSMKVQFDRHVRDTPLWKVGDEVWLSSRNISTTRPSPKLDYRWLGPFPISQVISRSTYKLTLPLSMKGVHPVFHVSVLRRHNTDTIEGRPTPPPPPVIIDGEEEWEVDEILNSKMKWKTQYYLVSWKNFGPEANSWEPEKNLTNCKALLDEFNRRFPQNPTRLRRRRRRK